LGLAASLSHCRGRSGGEGDAKLERARCASACADLAANCRTEVPVVARQAQCVEACSRVRRDAARAGCQSEQDQALSCLSTAQITCEKAPSTRSVLEQGHGVEGCQAEFARLLRCAAPCREPGVVRSAARSLAVDGATREVKAELTTLGCGPDRRPLERRSPPGAPCEHFSVCSQALCSCPGSNAAYLARTCVDGTCAADTLACRLAPSAVGHAACPGR
jgi:hypothetical protein